MVEVVNLDSDEEEDNLTYYNSLTTSVKRLSPSGGLFDALLYNLDEMRRRCPDSYLQSNEFRRHLQACKSGLTLLNFTSKLNALVQNMVSYCVDIPPITTQSGQPQKRRRLDPPRPDKSTEPVIIHLNEGASESSSTSQPNLPSSNTTPICRAIPVQRASNTTTVTTTSSIRPGGTQPITERSEFEEIIKTLQTINATFSREPDVENVLKVFTSRIRSLNLDKNQKSISSVHAYCSKLSLEVKTPLSLLYHLRKLLMMSYFMEINPVEIRPEDWFAAYYQRVPYHLSEYVTFAIFKRLLAKVLPPTRAKMVELFHQKFRSALHGVKRTVLDRISKLEFTDDDEKLQNKSYAATILCCLGDCMEIFIKSKTSSTTTLKDSSRGSSPAAIDVGSKRSSDVESEKLCESSKEKRKQPESSVSTGSTSPNSGSLIEQNIVAFPTTTEASDNNGVKTKEASDNNGVKTKEASDNNGANSEGTGETPEVLPSETSGDKEAGQSGENDPKPEADQEKNHASSSEVVDNSKKVEEIKIDGKDIDDEEKSKQVEEHILEGVTKPDQKQPEETSLQMNEEIFKFSCIIASVDEQQTNQQETSGVSHEESIEDIPSCHEHKTSDNQDSVEKCDLESSVKSVDNLAAAQTDFVESSEVEQVIDQKRKATTTSDSLEIIEPNNGLAEINDAPLPSKDNSDSGAVTDESEDMIKPDKALDQSKELIESGDDKAGSTTHLDGKEELSGDCMEICNGSSEKGDLIPLSQQSVEFIDETSHDCMITSVKPSNVQYVEIKLGSAKTDISHSSTSKDHVTKSDKLPDHTFQNADSTGVTNICDPPATLSPPQPPKRVTLQSLSLPKTESDDKPDSGKRRLSLKAAPGAVKIPACFKMDAQPGSSLITISDSEDEIEPKEESESEDPDVDEETEEYKQKIAQIEKLSRKLVRLARRIKAVQEADIDDAEMDKWGNLYLQESKLKKKHRKILAKLEEIQGELNCHYYFDVKINCGIPVLSNYIEERLNARQKFPDIQDVRRLIERGLKECKISMKEKKIKTLAKQVFLDAGSQIQNHRKTELKLDGGFHLMDQVDITKDPAKDDPVLRKKLKKNKSEAKRKLRDIQATFDARQLERELLDNDIFDDGASGDEDSSKKEGNKEKDDNQTTAEKEKDKSESESESSEKENESEGQEGSCDDDDDMDTDD